MARVSPPTFDRTEQPLYILFAHLYEHGYLAVDLFFSLSGFIFFWLYSSNIYSRQVAASRFFILRFSRLYPLHLLTFLVVALGQHFYLSAFGTPFVYGHNDKWHFLLNLFFLSSVGLERGWSYNAPVWSVSVEVVLYAVFFAVSRFLKPRLLVAFALSLFGLILVFRLNAHLGRGMTSFFLGGGVYVVYARIVTLRRQLIVVTVTAVACVAAWIGALCGASNTEFLRGMPGIRGLPMPFEVLVVFPLTILSLAIVESYRGHLGRRFSALGDISYSSYLWHFPLQLLFVSVVSASGLENSVFRDSSVLILYFVVLISVSWLSFRYFEVPAQRYIRSKCLKRR